MIWNQKYVYICLLLVSSNHFKLVPWEVERSFGFSNLIQDADRLTAVSCENLCIKVWPFIKMSRRPIHFLFITIFISQILVLKKCRAIKFHHSFIFCKMKIFLHTNFGHKTSVNFDVHRRIYIEMKTHRSSNHYPAAESHTNVNV